MTGPSFKSGLETLVSRNRRWLAKGALGLVTHPAAVDRRGAPATERLMGLLGPRLAALFGPEHGILGAAPAGARVGHARHPEWRIPVYSLYGKTRRPTPRMLRDLDAVIIDLQDLAARPYTYVTTLRYLMEEAAKHGVRVIVADRPVPLPCSVDGPLPAPGFESFVCGIPAPMCYGMTPGETATWLRAQLDLDLDLKISRMSGYHRDTCRGRGWPPWIPPSPGIKSWEAAQAYLATVFCEALPVVDNGRGTNLAFQLIGVARTRGRALCHELTARKLSGVHFHPHIYQAGFGSLDGKTLDGLRITVTNPRTFKPVTTAIHILDAIQQETGPARLWRSPQARPAFFDKLFGTDQVRKALMSGEPAGTIARTWRLGMVDFKSQRTSFLLYE